MRPSRFLSDPPHRDDPRPTRNAGFEDPAAAPLVIGDPVTGAILSVVLPRVEPRQPPSWTALAVRRLFGGAAARPPQATT
jgi:hypothetical protein